MHVLKIRSDKIQQGANERIKDTDALLIDDSIINSNEEITLAYELAKKSFEDKTNIARIFKYEFLLWLTKKRDIKSALEAARPKGNEAFLIIFEGGKNEILEKIGAKEIKFKLKKNADPLEIEEISLSRIT